jgi:excisionase family DNA binding protein
MNYNEIIGNQSARFAFLELQIEREVSLMEKLFTVEDIAKMASMTTRTIRNYLKDGTLEGRKIGGQWRFTEEDIKKFMDSGNASKEITEKNKQDVMDFIDGVNTDYTGEIQVCSIVDLYHEESTVVVKRDKLIAFINSDGNDFNPNYVRFSYEYIEKEQKGRFTLFAPPNYLIEALKILQ